MAAPGLGMFYGFVLFLGTLISEGKWRGGKHPTDQALNALRASTQGSAFHVQEFNLWYGQIFGE